MTTWYVNQVIAMIIIAGIGLIELAAIPLMIYTAYEIVRDNFIRK